MNTIINLNELKTYQSIVTLPKYGCISVTGEDAGTFLQGQVTCDVTIIKANTANRGSLCTHKGRMIASFYISPHDDGFWMIMPRSNIDNFLEHIKKFAVFSKVTLKDLSDDWHVAGVIGDATTPTESTLFKLNNTLNRAFCLTQTLDSSWQENTIWQGLNVLTRTTDIDANTTELFTPQMIDLQKFDGVSFTKGCYVGQEVVARTEHLGKLKRHLQYLQQPLGQTVKTGQSIKNNDGQAMGIITEYYYDRDYCHVLAVVEDRLFEPEE